VQDYTIEFRKMAIMLGISPKNLDVLFKYFGGIQRHLHEKVMLFNPKSVDEPCVQEQYLENIGLKEEKLSGSKQKEKQKASKEGKKKQQGGKIRRKHPQHTSANILATTTTLMVIQRKNPRICTYI